MKKVVIAVGVFSALLTALGIYPITPTEKSRLENVFKEIYQKNKVAEEKAAGEPRIPLKIHQIWIGPKPMPEKFKWMMESWQAFHPDWEYKLWTNADLETFPFINKEAFDAASNWGMKADILRYEILFYHGGLYADLDCECIKSYEPLNYAYDFYAGLLAPHEIGNGLIGAAQGSPILVNIIRALGAKVQQIQNCQTNDFWGILGATGPVFFSNRVMDYYKTSGDAARSHMMVFPSKYFYVFPCAERKDYWAGKVSREKVLSFVQPESYGIHYWATSWFDENAAKPASKPVNRPNPFITNRPIQLGQSFVKACAGTVAKNKFGSTLAKNTV